jgi:hypothetical protein
MTNEGSAVFGAQWRVGDVKIVEVPAAINKERYKTAYGQPSTSAPIGLFWSPGRTACRTIHGEEQEDHAVSKLDHLCLRARDDWPRIRKFAASFRAIKVASASMSMFWKTTLIRVR